jgi:hypothetical protein
MYVWVLNQQGNVQLHKNIGTGLNLFFELIPLYQNDVAFGVECVFSWHWLADLCASRHLSFILGHVLHMRAIHGGKTKNDKIDFYKIASLLKGGNFPVAYSLDPRLGVGGDPVSLQKTLDGRLGVADSLSLRMSDKWLHADRQRCKRKPWRNKNIYLVILYG